MLIHSRHTTSQQQSDAPAAGADHDVVVVGARCAGAATAMLFANQGFDVLVLERSEFPSDTLSTHSISRGGVVQLARWGLLDSVVASGAPEIRTIAFHPFLGEPVVKTVKARLGVDHLLAPRRYVLDAILVDAARAAGADVQTGVSVIDVTTDRTHRVTGVKVRDRDGRTRSITARLVVGADGVRSRIARCVDAVALDVRRPSGGTHYTYIGGLDSEGLEFHLGDEGLAGAFRTHNDEACLWICVPPLRALRGGSARHAGFVELLRSVAPSLAARIRGSEFTAPIRGAVGLPNHVLQATGPGWALAGDAGYHRDPITGHGITDAFRDAELLAYHFGRALAGESSEPEAMAHYDVERLRAMRPIFDVTCKLAKFPPDEQFAEAQRELSVLLELEAEWLASRPCIPHSGRVVAA
jgi:2-polyprenyl-6-methoxyphenol hydroxylase-like FAD-dependent oxidoreductase